MESQWKRTRAVETGISESMSDYKWNENGKKSAICLLIVPADRRQRGEWRNRWIGGSGALPHRIIPRARAQAKLTVEMLKFEIQIEQQKTAAFVSLSFFFAHKKSK